MLRYRVGQRSATSALALINLISISRLDNNGKQINFIRKHIGGCGTLKKGAKESTQNGRNGRAKARTAGEKEDREEGKEKEKGKEEPRREGALRRRKGPKTGGN